MALGYLANLSSQELSTVWRMLLDPDTTRPFQRLTDAQLEYALCLIKRSKSASKEDSDRLTTELQHRQLGLNPSSVNSHFT